MSNAKQCANTTTAQRNDAIVQLPELDLNAFFERSDYVLWTFTPDGAILNNTKNGVFFELDRTGHQIWSLLDGTYSAIQIKAILARRKIDSKEREASVLILELLERGFILRVGPDGTA